MAAYNTKTENKLDETFFWRQTPPVPELLSKSIFPNQANHPDQFDQSHSAKSDTQKNRSTKVGKKKWNMNLFLIYS